MRAPTRIATSRLLLRPAGRDDAAAIFETYAGRDAPTRYMTFPRHRSLSESQIFAERCERCWADGSAFPWAVVETVSQRFAGLIELRLQPPKADFGYVLGEAFWGRGYATEASRAVADWTMEQPSIRRLWATCHPDNRASARVLIKTGLSLETTLAHWEARPQLGEDAGPSLVFARLKPVSPPPSGEAG